MFDKGIYIVPKYLPTKYLLTNIYKILINFTAVTPAYLTLRSESPAVR